MSDFLPPRAAYVHIPFCAHHCGYCDFAVVTGADDQIDLYIEALACELATLDQRRSIDTLFLGGGTPTHLNHRQLATLFGHLHEWFELTEGAEVTVEANPGTLSADKVRVLAASGVNRVSLGAQSFRPEILRVLERDHEPGDVPRAVDTVRKHIGQVALDLIFGVPGQSLEGWQSDLRAALSLQPDHVSTYGLTYEKGTRLWKQRARQELEPVAEELELAMYESALDVLGQAGFVHYEISNHARPGRECRHNLIYWANEPYYGFGIGAARYIDGRREINRRDLHGYMKAAFAREPVTHQSEMLEARERARETMAIQLRRGAGINCDLFLLQTGFALSDVTGESLERIVALGLLEREGVWVRLTRRGKCVADAVICELMAE